MECYPGYRGVIVDPNHTMHQEGHDGQLKKVNIQTGEVGLVTWKPGEPEPGTESCQ